MPTDLSTLILEDCVSKTRLDYIFVIDQMCALTNSKNGYIFEADGLNFVCKYSTNINTYRTNMEYEFDSLPPENVMYIFENSNIIAAICIENLGYFDENYTSEEKQRIQNCICLGLILNKVKYSDYNYNQTLCTRLEEIITEIYDELSTVRNIPQVTFDSFDAYIDEALNIVSDLRDYISISSDKVVVNKYSVNLRNFINKCREVVQKQVDDGYTIETIFSRNISPEKSSYVETSSDQNLIEKLKFDQEQLGRVLVTSLKRLVRGGHSITINVTVKDTGLYKSSEFLLEISISSNVNDKVTETFKPGKLNIDNVSVHINTRLCNLMGGTYEIVDDVLKIKIVCQN